MAGGGASGRIRPGVSHWWIDSAGELSRLVDALGDESEIALDTEFHRERTYHPHLALLQLGWGETNIALVDAPAVDLTPLRPVITGPATIVMHAAAQDLEVLIRACGALPAHAVRHADRGRFRGLQQPVAGDAGRGGPVRATPQG